jgi:hypothetical protein
MTSRFLNKNKFLLAFVSISIIGLLLSCKKDSNDYQISYTSNNSTSTTWNSDKINAIIRIDTLLLTGQKDDKSSIAIIVSSSSVGNYEMSVSDLKTVIAIDKDGSKSKESQFISVDGVVSIFENNKDKKYIRGSFEVNVINLANINAKEKVQGNFTSKYKEY